MIIVFLCTQGVKMIANSTEPFADDGGRREYMLDHVWMVFSHGKS